MDKPMLRITLYATVIYLTGGLLASAVASPVPLWGDGTHSHGHRDFKGPDNRNYARTFAANLNVGEPRTVRLIYSRPNDRPPRQDIDTKIDALIRDVQRFYADQMENYGFGRKTFTFETDVSGKALVHHVDGQFTDSYYHEGTFGKVQEEIDGQFDTSQNIYFVVVDVSTEDLGSGVAGFGSKIGDWGGMAAIPASGRFFNHPLAAHELGHTFGLGHDFRTTDHIMSFGPWPWGRTAKLSKCAAEQLEVHRYFNSNIPIIEEGSPPTIELISPRAYPAGSKSSLIRLKVSDSEGLHQVLLSGADGLIACHGLAGEKDTVVEFDYDGDFTKRGFMSLSSDIIHSISVAVVDRDGNVRRTDFVLFSEALEPLTKISGDNQHGLPNTALPVPFVVELRDLNDGSPRYGVWVTFTVTAGGGTLSVERVKTDYEGRAESVLTLGPNFGTNTVSVSAERLRVTFNAVAGAPMDIPDANLRAAIDSALNKAPGTPIAPADMATLTHLAAQNANISDLTGLEAATNLTELNLRTNSISDISALVSNAGLGNGDTVDVKRNPLNYASINTHIPALQRRGVEVHFDNRTATTLLNISGVITASNNTLIVEVRANDGRTFAGVPVTFAVTSGGGTLSVTNTTTEANGRAESILTLGKESNRVTASAVGVERTVTFSDVAAGVHIADPNLRAAIESALGLEPGHPISPGNMADLTRLEAPNANISDLTGLEHATNLRVLYLWRNTISDISVVSGLTNLTYLDLGSYSITDISAVSGLTNLTTLNLSYNNISDISALAGLTNLTSLYLQSNSITDISVLAGLTNLTRLDLWENSIRDISAVSGLTNLTRLVLQGNRITDISAVSTLTNLTILGLGHNSIRDISAVSGLTNLTSLSLQSNTISDISAVSGLTNLTSLWLQSNTTSDISAVSTLTNLTALRLSDNAISDLSPLVANLGLESGASVLVTGNPLSYQSIHTHIPILQSRGVTVEFDNQAHPALLKISGGHQRRLPGETLASPFIVEVQDENGSPFAGVSVTFAITEGGGTLSIQTTTTDANGRAESTLTLGPNFGTHTVSVSVLGIEGRVIFHAIADSPDSDVADGVHIPDPNLRAAIESALGKASGATITTADMANLTVLQARNADISDLTGLEYAVNLEWLDLGWELIDGDLVNSNSVSDLSPLRGLTNLTSLYLQYNSITDISAVSGLTNLTSLYLQYNSITDISAVSTLTNLTHLFLGNNNISDISPVAGLTNLTDLYLSDNNISDISSVSGLTNLTDLYLGGNPITDISSVSGLTNLTWLGLYNNSITDISSVSGLTNLTWLGLYNNNISDISDLVANTGLGTGDRVSVNRNPLSYASIHTHIPALQSRGVTVEFDNQAHPALLKISGGNQRHLPGETLASPFIVEVQDENGSPFAGVLVTFAITEGGGTLSIQTTTTDANGRAESTLTLGPNFGTNTVSVSAAGIEGRVIFHAIADNPEFLWSIPAGINTIHVPLKVTAVDDVPQPITSIGDLYDALGGAATVTFLLTRDSQTQEWHIYFGTSDTGTPADRVLTDDMGIIAGMITPVSVRLSGNPLGTNGSSTITLNPGKNLVGLPLRDSRITHVSDLFALKGIDGNVSKIELIDTGERETVGRVGDPGDIAITGGQAFIMTASRAATVTISGEGWYNTSAIAAAPPLSLKGIEVDDVTPVLGVRGSVVAPVDGLGKMPHLLQQSRVRVIVKNLSTGKAVAGVTKDVLPSHTGQGGGYQVVIVDIETGRAAKIGDILEISVRSPSPLIGVQPVRYTVTAEDVKRSLIQLPELVAYEIPAETQLLANYPNPFNPETWIPYRLAEDAFVTLTIYDQTGQVVRSLEVGHRIAAVYESRSKAIYWDGRNEFGEPVASGVFFYQLRAGDYSATRKMVIIK